jgi:hypothetical protein
MASGDDPLADIMNMQGYQGLVGQNPYLQYQGQIPMAGYYGTPTNAQGQNIPSFMAALAASQAPQGSPTPGTTLNSSPSGPQDYMMNPQTGMMGPNPAAFQGGIDPSTGLTIQQANQATNRYYNPQAGSMVGGQSQGWGGSGGSNVGGTMMMPSPASMAAPWANQQQAPAAAPPTSSGVNMRQAYLDALSNPGPVPTYGAAMQPGAAATGSPQPNVVANFLANNAAKTGAGGYTNKPFFSTLQALQSGGTQPTQGATA